MPPPLTPPPLGNQLGQEKSPYLLQHAHNPVHWQPWGETAFARARAEDKPIFLSIGYSTCHWCHVMAHESFEDPATAAVLNELFVNIKLDREERPDIDRVYMTFVQASTGSGGWPMSVWLQPDLKPFFGGTYYPPDDRYGRRGFVSVCRAIAHAWQEDRAKVLAQSGHILDSLREMTQPRPNQPPGLDLPLGQLLQRAAEPLARAYDPEWGGFGDAPKFPRPVTLQLLARITAHAEPETAANAREMLLGTLDRMAAGGMHDQLGGGFHRYSVDRYWHVPHYEKMLYDQAQLVLAYLGGWALGGDPAHAETARDILAYVRRDLTSPGGGFYCAEDADSLIAAGRPEHAEGAFYVWTQAEIGAALTPDEAALVRLHYGVQAEGNSPPGSDPHGELAGKNTLTRAVPLADAAAQLGLTAGAAAALLADARGKLFAQRERRPRPHLDDKIVTAWNGLMISAFARAYQMFGEERDLVTAQQAADFLGKHLCRATDGALLRSYREGPSSILAFADDYACLIQGLLDLFEADFNPAHLRWAEELQARQDALFYDDPRGGYFSAADNPDVLLRLKEDHDGAEPSASSVSALNLARLAAFAAPAAAEHYRERAVATARAFGAWEQPERLAQSMPLLLVAVDFLSRPPAQLVIAGRRAAADTQALLRAVRPRFALDVVVLVVEPGAAALMQRLPFLATAQMQAGRATAYLCEHQVCSLPTSEPETLIAMLAARQVSATESSAGISFC